MLYRCLPCFKLKPAASQQLMGQLPLVSVTASRPFVNAGIDYVGPFEIKGELVSNLTFIAALKTLIAIRE